MKLGLGVLLCLIGGSHSAFGADLLRHRDWRSGWFARRPDIFRSVTASSVDRYTRRSEVSIRVEGWLHLAVGLGLFLAGVVLVAVGL